jgi:hypothetical protein
VLKTFEIYGKQTQTEKSLRMVEGFEVQRTNVHDGCCGRTSNVTCDGVKKRTGQRIRDNQKNTVCQSWKEVVYERLTVQPKAFNSNVITKLVDGWKKCIENQGHYVKQWGMSNRCMVTLSSYERVSKSFRTCRLKRELQMTQLSVTKCSYIAILWISLVSFAAITLCVASQRVFIVVSVYFVMDSVRKRLDTHSCMENLFQVWRQF